MQSVWSSSSGFQVQTAVHVLSPPCIARYHHLALSSVVAWLRANVHHNALANCVLVTHNQEYSTTGCCTVAHLVRTAVLVRTAQFTDQQLRQRHHIGIRPAIQPAQQSKYWCLDSQALNRLRVTVTYCPARCIDDAYCATASRALFWFDRTSASHAVPHMQLPSR